MSADDKDERDSEVRQGCPKLFPVTVPAPDRLSISMEGIPPIEEAARLRLMSSIE